jgi:phosphoglycerate kinase
MRPTAKLSIDDVDVAGRRVLMRVDFNVPLDADGVITDDRRIRLALPSIRSVIERGGRLVLMSHFGRPQGTGYEARFSLKPAADRLRELLSGVTVTLAPHDCVGEQAIRLVQQSADGSVVVLENLRFHKGEKEGDAALAEKLAAFGDLYCNEAFGTAHRNDASMVAVPRAMSDKPRAAGLLLQKELLYLSQTIEHAHKPFIAVLGGAKVSDKLGAIGHLSDKVDVILIGGAMAYTFLKARGTDVGSSRVEPDMIEHAARILEKAGRSGAEIRLPVDHACATRISPNTNVQVHTLSIPDGWMGLDIGPETYSEYREVINGCRTVVWNGPMGVFETPPFDVGTRRVAEAVVEATEHGAVSVVGGGDTAAAVEAFGLAEKCSHVSTGGGASLQMLEGTPFESVRMLSDV